MTNYQVQAYIEKIVYILRKIGGIDFYRLFKIMYAAQREYLKEYGMTIFPDEFHALRYGPVPTMLYDAVKSIVTPITDDFQKSVERGTEDASNMLSALREADMDYIAPKELEVIDKAIAENATLPFNTLKDKYHTPAWKTSYERTDKAMHDIEIAQDSGASDYAITNLLINQSFNRAFQCQ